MTYNEINEKAKGFHDWEGNMPDDMVALKNDIISSLLELEYKRFGLLDNDNNSYETREKDMDYEEESYTEKDKEHAEKNDVDKYGNIIDEKTIYFRGKYLLIDDIVMALDYLFKIRESNGKKFFEYDPNNKNNASFITYLYLIAGCYANRRTKDKTKHIDGLKRDIVKGWNCKHHGERISVEEIKEEIKAILHKELIYQFLELESNKSRDAVLECDIVNNWNVQHEKDCVSVEQINEELKNISHKEIVYQFMKCDEASLIITSTDTPIGSDDEDDDSQTLGDTISDESIDITGNIERIEAIKLLYETFKKDSNYINSINKAKEFIARKSIFSYRTIKEIKTESYLTYPKDSMQYVSGCMDFVYESCKEAREFWKKDIQKKGKEDKNTPAINNGFVEYHIYNRPNTIKGIVENRFIIENGVKRFTGDIDKTISAFLGLTNAHNRVDEYNRLEKLVLGEENAN